MELQQKLPVSCPSCDAKLKVKTLQCDTCNTSVNGFFDLPPISHLTLDELSFILNFVKLSGSLKEMAKHLGLSYPSVRNILDDIIEKIKKIEENQK